MEKLREFLLLTENRSAILLLYGILVLCSLSFITNVFLRISIYFALFFVVSVNYTKIVNCIINILTHFKK